MDKRALEQALGGAYPVRLFEKTASTNLAAKEWAKRDAPHGAVVAARRQTAGRGRLGRGFASPAGGIYCSIVLRLPPGIAAACAHLVTPAAAVAVCRALAETCGLETGVKWVNDIFFGGKKICGILAESECGPRGNFEFFVVGIGVNYQVDETAYPPEVRAVAGSLFAPPAAGCVDVKNTVTQHVSENAQAAPPPAETVAAAIHTHLLSLCAALPDTAFLDEYRRRSLVLGRSVQVLASPPYSAVATAIDDNAALLVQTGDGAAHVLSAGEISVKL